MVEYPTLVLNILPLWANLLEHLSCLLYILNRPHMYHTRQDTLRSLLSWWVASVLFSNHQGLIMVIRQQQHYQPCSHNHSLVDTVLLVDTVHTPSTHHGYPLREEISRLLSADPVTSLMLEQLTGPLMGHWDTCSGGGSPGATWECGSCGVILLVLYRDGLIITTHL